MLDVAPRTVERSIRKMEQMGLISRSPAYLTEAGMRRDFDLRPLVAKVQKLADHDVHVLAERRQQREQERQDAPLSGSDDFDDHEEDLY